MIYEGTRTCRLWRELPGNLHCPLLSGCHYSGGKSESTWCSQLSGYGIYWCWTSYPNSVPMCWGHLDLSEAGVGRICCWWSGISSSHLWVMTWVKTQGVFTNKPWHKSWLVSKSRSESRCRSARWWLAPRLSSEYHNRTDICFTNTRNYCHRNKIYVLTSLLKQIY